MKINMIPTKRLAMLSAAVCAVMLAFGHNAAADTTLAFNDQYVVGTTSPGAPASASDVADYINFMTGLALGQTVTHDFGQPEGVQTISRSMNTFGSLPTAVGDSTAVSGTGTTIDLNTLGTFTYLFAKYDGQNDESLVWNITGLTGVLTIPALGPDGHGLSGWILFGPNGFVPDGGTTVMLLGTALGALGMVRRYLFKS